MRYNFLTICFVLLTSIFSSAQQNFDIIPKPNSVVVNNGVYQFKPKTTIQVSAAFKDVATLLTEHPAIKSIAITLITKDRKYTDGTIVIEQATTADQLNKDAYSINIKSNSIIIKAWNRQQAIHAVYTLVQLGYLQSNPTVINAATIIDQPRFSYRGLHLDVSRHFMPLSFVKKYIDLMALYKFNNFHWHITDGAGWRLEIKKYPELTQKAAWRTHTLWKDWWHNGRRYVDAGSPNASGGFFTQQQAKEIVAYAAKKGINIIPEIEMPGHSEEVIAAYPQLSCTGIPYSQSEFCIGNPQTFEFLRNVLDEVLAIFPSKYIHIGGDEADKKHWEKCPKDQALMKREGLKSVDELQSYAVKQMDQYLQSKGRILIGWDEILEGGLSAGATVMSWRGEAGGIQAANAGHDVIMTPSSHLYFDAYQADPRTQPEAIGGFLPLDKVYSYDPIPAAIAPDKRKHILGAQANLWAEYISTTEQAEYMVYPRALALAEVNWTKENQKDWNDFHKRLQSHYAVLQKLNVNYYRPSYNIGYTVQLKPESTTNIIELTTEQNQKQNIHYTLDGSKPTVKSKAYTGAFELDKSSVVNAAYFMDSIQIGPLLNFRIDIHKAIGKKVLYNSKWDSYAAQKEATLTNGIMGGLTYHDGQWQGFTRSLDLVVDMETVQPVQTVAMNFMQLIGPGVYMPGEVEILFSDDGKNFHSVGVIKNDISDQISSLTFKRFELNLPSPINARYIQVKATNPKKGFLFTDEIIVY